MGRTRMAWVLVALGAALVALSALADPIGLGDAEGIGWKQSIGMVAGVVVLVAGVGLWYRRRSENGSSQAAT
jgi:nitrate reductase gamma subunit